VPLNLGGLPREERRRRILAALEETSGVVRRAATNLGIHNTLICYHIRELGMRGEVERIRNRWRRFLLTGRDGAA
jgi:transcriptional regulator with GAF, ATPase, and Fis domain